jgi:hypothetical protein
MREAGCLRGCPAVSLRGLEPGADYFSDTTFPLIYRTVRPHNALKFHIFPEN